MKREQFRNNMILFGSVVVITVMLFGYALPDQEMSVSERRQLANMPEFSVKDIVSGEYMTDMETYVSDHIPGREAFRKLYTIANQYLFFRKEINGYVQKEDAIYRVEEELSTEYISRNARYFENIRETYFPDNLCYYAVIPDKNYYLDLPCGYQRFDYEKQLSILDEELNAKNINLQDCLALESYYRTDLHWRQECLEPVRSRLLQEMDNIGDFSLEYIQQLATDSFAGSYLLTSGYRVTPDKLICLNHDNLQQVTVWDYEKEKYMSVYTMERVGEGDDYDVFLGGAKALLTLENAHAASDKELIIFRDSYTSSLAPLLVDSYSKITLVDVRYTKPAYALSRIKWNEKTQVLFLYQAMTLNGNVFR